LIYDLKSWKRIELNRIAKCQEIKVILSPKDKTNVPNKSHKLNAVQCNFTFPKVAKVPHEEPALPADPGRAWTSSDQIAQHFMKRLKFVFCIPRHLGH